MGKKPHAQKKQKKKSRNLKLAEQMAAEQQRTADALHALSTAVGELSPSSGDRLLAEIRTLLDDVLVAQHRTNHLLELALRAGFDEEEHARNP